MIMYWMLILDNILIVIGVIGVVLLYISLPEILFGDVEKGFLLRVMCLIFIIICLLLIPSSKQLKILYPSIAKELACRQLYNQDVNKNYSNKSTSIKQETKNENNGN